MPFLPSPQEMLAEYEAMEEKEAVRAADDTASEEKDGDASGDDKVIQFPGRR